MRRVLPYLIAVFLAVFAGNCAFAQNSDKSAKQISLEQHRKEVMQYIVEDNDTIFIGQQLTAARIYDKLPKQKGKEWRKYYKLVYNFNKVYPYALMAKRLDEIADSTITTDKLRGAKKEKYVNGLQKQLFDSFETTLRNMTMNQGVLLLRLVDRETGKSTYNIIKTYLNGAAAGFWHGIAKLFGANLKTPYDPEGLDVETEELVKLWESGEFDGLYYSLFGEFPEKVIPPSYIK